jgi:hypothetical protein
MFDVLLPKVTDQENLGKALKSIVIYRNQDMFNAILPKITNRDKLSDTLEETIRYRTQWMFDTLLPQITDQKSLGKALERAVNHNWEGAFNELLHKVTDQESLDKALEKAKEHNLPSMINSIQNHQNYRYYIGDAVDLLLSAGTTVNEWFKKNDPLKICRGVEAASVSDTSNVITTNILTNPTSQITTNALPGIDREDNTAEKQMVQTSDGRFADTINERLFMGTAALAVTIKTLGQDTDWAKPILGSGAAKVDMDFNPQDLLSYMNPEYDYSALLKEETKKNAPPLQKAALERVTELAKSGEVANWSKEQWQNFIKNDKKLKVFLEVTLEKAKIREANARPLTQADLGKLNTLPKPKGNIRRRD